jgi:hypothetical protein
MCAGFHSVSWAALRAKNGGWSFALNFCFFLFNQKEKEEVTSCVMDTFSKSIRKKYLHLKRSTVIK